MKNFPDITLYLNDIQIYKQITNYFLMIQAQKIARMFAKVKPLKISVLATDPKIKIKSDTMDHSW